MRIIGGDPNFLFTERLVTRRGLSPPIGDCPHLLRLLLSYLCFVRIDRVVAKTRFNDGSRCLVRPFVLLCQSWRDLVNIK